MFRRSMLLFLIIFLSSINVSAVEFRYIEIFDITQGKVSRVVQSNPEIQKLAEKYIKDITGIYPKFNPIPEKGYGIRIPLDPPVQIQNKFLNTLVDEVFIMLPGEEEPFLMVFQTENKFVCFTFKGDIRELLRRFDYAKIKPVTGDRFYYILASIP